MDKRTKYPGGMVGNVPAFNKANTDFVTQSNTRLHDLPRYLKANGHKVISEIVAEQLDRYAQAARHLSAVIHQMEQGEASDFIDGVAASHPADQTDACRFDLRWCRNEIRTALKLVSS